MSEGEAGAIQAGSNIFIDDERAPPPGEWQIARTASDFEQFLETRPPAIISFDHDLGCDDAGATLPNGHDCVRLLIEAAMDRPDVVADLRIIVLHSANPVGRANMRGLIEGAVQHGILPAVRLIDMPVTSQPLATWSPSLLRW